LTKPGSLERSRRCKPVDKALIGAKTHPLPCNCICFHEEPTDAPTSSTRHPRQRQMLERGAQGVTRKFKRRGKIDSSQKAFARAVSEAADSNALISPAAPYPADEPPDVKRVGIACMYLFLRIPHDILLIGD